MMIMRTEVEGLARGLDETADELRQLEAALAEIMGLLDAGALTGATADRLRTALADQVVPFARQLESRARAFSDDLRVPNPSEH
jgi:hypothetical protein